MPYVWKYENEPADDAEAIQRVAVERDAFDRDHGVDAAGSPTAWREFARLMQIAGYETTQVAAARTAPPVLARDKLNEVEPLRWIELNAAA